MLLASSQEVLGKFTNKELISQAAFTSDYETLLRDGPDATGVFSRLSTFLFTSRHVTSRHVTSRHVTAISFISSTRDEAGEKRWSDLKARVVEHNIRMMAQYYTKIRYCSSSLAL